MPCADLFPDLFDGFSTTAHFSEATIAALEERLSERNGKPYLKCFVRNKDVMAKPEEIVRQLWLHTLIHRYKYPVSRIAVEYPVTMGRDSSKRADIMIFDADRATYPYIVIEVKQGKMKDGKEQLRSYANATGAPLAVWSDGNQFVVWNRKEPNYFKEIPTLPGAHETIEMIAGQPWTIDTLIEYEKQRELEGAKGRSLRELIEDLENEVLANAGVDVFEEVFKLIFTKLFDELHTYSYEGEHLRFRNVNTAAQTKKAIQDLFDEAREKWEGVFAPDEKIRLTPEHLQVCVGSLEKWKLFNSNLDVVDEKSVRVSRCLNLIAGDGQTNVLHLNTLDYKRWDETTKQPDWIDIYNNGWKKLRKLMAAKNDYRAFSFDVLMANPPFAGDIKQTDMLSPYDLAHKLTKEGELGKLEKKVGRDLLFIERNLDFLKPGGRMAVVFPQGRFNNASDQRVREFIADRCRLLGVVGIHPNTFKPHTGTKTSVLFVQKWTEEEKCERDALKIEIGLDWEIEKIGRNKRLTPKEEAEAEKSFAAAHPATAKLDYNIFFATQRRASKDNSGDKIYETRLLKSWYEKDPESGEWKSQRRQATEEEFAEHNADPDARPVLYELILDFATTEIIDAKELKKRGLKYPDPFNARIRQLTPYFHRERVRDDHGHWIVVHDLFSTAIHNDSGGGHTPEGIAEAFQEFAAKEKLSFF